MTETDDAETTSMAKDHNVYKNKARRSCLSYKGPGSPVPADAYQHKFGPDTLAACNKWIDDECNEGGGTQCN